MGTKDLKKISKVLALEQIAKFNNLTIPENKVTLRTAKPFDMNTNDADTFVEIKIDEDFDSRFSGEIGFFYKRLTLFPILNGKSFTIYKQHPFTVHDVLEDINREHELNLNKNDVYNYTLNSSADVFQLRLFANNLAWTSPDITMIPNYSLPVNFRTTEDGVMRTLENGLPRELN
jgi:hypothetical protein